jgi:hypothetical protein
MVGVAPKLYTLQQVRETVAAAVILTATATTSISKWQIMVLVVVAIAAICAKKRAALPAGSTADLRLHKIRRCNVNSSL